MPRALGVHFSFFGLPRAQYRRTSHIGNVDRLKSSVNFGTSTRDNVYMSGEFVRLMTLQNRLRIIRARVDQSYRTRVYTPARIRFEIPKLFIETDLVRSQKRRDNRFRSVREYADNCTRFV